MKLSLLSQCGEKASRSARLQPCRGGYCPARVGQIAKRKERLFQGDLPLRGAALLREGRRFFLREGGTALGESSRCAGLID